MKKIFLLLFSISFLQVKATTHVVTVANFQFSPANLNVVVGDVIRWQWASGFHTIESQLIPTGASAWLSNTLSASGNFFEYTVTTIGVYNYRCGIHTASMLGTFTASPLLPVTLSAFKVSRQGNNPYLTWATQVESNSDYFAVRRSYDGNIFTEIGKVPAAGYSSVVKIYSFTDVTIKSNSKYVYYELAITDKDEKVQLSPIKLFKNNTISKKLITSISPNPVSEAGHLMIQFNADESGILKARITDMTGKQVLTSDLDANAGVNNGHIHLADLPKGNYAIQFNLNGMVETYKISKN